VGLRFRLASGKGSAYFDLQNVYNHLYPEIPIYSADWSVRQGAIGLPIYPSIGVSVQY
jgi:hypothetical protein